jgi:predicted negative regulator of RcsB-dependent stress response
LLTEATQRWRLAVVQAELAYVLGRESQEGQTSMRAALTSFQAAGDSLGAADALAFLGLEAVADTAAGLAGPWLSLANLAADLGDLAVAHGHLHEALQSHPSEPLKATILQRLGEVRQDQNRVATARAAWQEAATTWSALGDGDAAQACTLVLASLSPAARPARVPS